MNLRPYQTEIVTEVRSLLKQGLRRPLTVSPTGSGKTVMFSHIAHGAGLKQKRVWILVHRQELIEQTSRTMREFSVPHGIIAAGWPVDPLPHVQIVSVQTVVRRVDGLLPPDVIIVDECHHAAAGTWAKILTAFPNAVVLGFTATPERLDGKGLADAFDAIIRGPEVAWLIEQGFLTQPVYYAPPNQLNLDGLHVRGGDYARDEVNEMMDKPTITGDIVAHYHRLCPGVPAVAFCASIAHAEHVAQAFTAAGYTAAALDGTLDRIERRKRVRALQTGELQILTSCEIISEGFDIPVVTAAILARPTKSLGMHLQQVGRVLRPVYGSGYDLNTQEGRLWAIAGGPKPRAIILDHVGNCLRHGLAEEMREWSLEGRKKKKRGASDDDDAPPVRQCPKCYACHVPAPICPECGHTYELKKREIERVDGELVELKARVKRPPTPEEIERDRAALETIRLERNAKVPDGHEAYLPGWVDYIIKARIKNCVTDPVDPEATIAVWKGEQTMESFRRQQQGQADSFEALVELGKSRGYKNAVFWAKRVWNARQQRKSA